MPQPGPADSWGGTLTTATGLLFVAAEGGSLLAVDAATGNVLWSFLTNQLWKASRMTYSMDGRQFIAIVSGPNVIAFGVR